MDQHHDMHVEDPYRWLEDTTSERSRRWIREQKRLTQAHLASSPFRAAVQRRLTELWDFERYSAPVNRGGRYFWSRNRGLQDQDVVVVAECLDAEPRVLLDPNQLSEDGTVALTTFEISPDGRWMAFGLSSGGSDWQEWRIREVATGRDLPDHLRWIKFSSVSWSRDGSGFYYSRYDAPEAGDRLAAVNQHHKVCYHRLGTLQEDDVLVYARPDRGRLGFTARVAEDGRYLGIEAWDGSRPETGFFYRDLADPEGRVVALLDTFDARYKPVGSVGSVFWFLTDLDAPRGRLIAIDLTRPGRESWSEVLPECDDVLEAVNVLGDRFVARYLRDARHVVRLFKLDGTLCGDIELPSPGTVSGFAGERDDRETFFSFTSFTTPPTVYRYDFDRDRVSLYRRPEVAFEPERYVTRQVFYESEDGTPVPMFIIHRKGLEPDGHTPVHLYGYGGFNVAVTPSFSVANLAWLEMGGIYAVANVRGGGEYGEDWHRAATGVNKQRSFDDFVAAASWLIDRGYTRRELLAVSGSSNGGLLVGASITQHPELFGAALVRVGVLDMLRFHKFTIGWAWVSDYGSPEDPEEFRALRAYSPYHNIRANTDYPATLVITADHDDRVVPAHSFKFAAALQEAQAGPRPILVRVETRAGHGAGTPTRKRIEQSCDELVFLMENLELEVDPEAPRMVTESAETCSSCSEERDAWP